MSSFLVLCDCFFAYTIETLIPILFIELFLRPANVLVFLLPPSKLLIPTMFA
jgi:hypothetical protein